VTTINDASLSAKKGKIFGLPGSNGAGKTTTIHIIATLLKPTSGKVLASDIDVSEKNTARKGKDWNGVSRPSLDNQLTAYDNMYIHGKLHGIDKSVGVKTNELLELVELRDFKDKQVRFFSGVMRRRLEIARSLLHESEVLVLDEPTIGLKPQSKNTV
jgi:ABC-2 type transport system ATP-binding protein